MMEKSTKCLTLSRFSGVFCGCYAIVGAIVAKYLMQNPFGLDGAGRKLSIAAVAVAVLVLSLLTAGFLSERKARKTGESIFSGAAKKIHASVFICLLPGGVLSIAMALNSSVEYITAVMLCFYGLALITASRYTFKDVLYLGYGMLFFGLINSFLTQYGLFFWTLGFGVLHIVYGVLMYFKYERKTK